MVAQAGTPLVWHTYTHTHKAWSHPGWTHDRRGRHGVTKPLMEEGLCVCLCVGYPTLEVIPPLRPRLLLRKLATAHHLICMVTPLLSLLIKIGEIYLCMHTQYMHTQSQQVAGLAQHSRPDSKVKHTAISFSVSLPRDSERKWETEDKINEKKLSVGLCHERLVSTDIDNIRKNCAVVLFRYYLTNCESIHQHSDKWPGCQSSAVLVISPDMSLSQSTKTLLFCCIWQVSSQEIFWFTQS